MANEIDLDFGSLNLNSTNNITIEKISVKERKRVMTHKIPKSDMSAAETARREKLTIDVSGDIAGTDYDDLRSNLDALKAGLQNGSQKFTTDDDRFIMAQMSGFNYNYVSLKIMAKWKATFIAHDPVWYSETEHTDTRTPSTGVGYTINNAGNAPTRCKIAITAPGGDITDDMQIENTTKGQLCKYRGTVTAADVLEIDNRYDTDDFEVLNDGTDDKKNFEGDFIDLDAGNNTIELTGTMGSTTITWRDAWY